MGIGSFPRDEHEHSEHPQTGSWSTSAHVSRWQAGDDTAFTALHDRFAPLLKQRVSRHRAWPALIGRLQIEDVVQEIWTRLIPAVGRKFTSAGPGSFFAFLGKLTDRVVIDLVRVQRAAKRGEFNVEQSLRTNAELHVVKKPVAHIVETPTGVARCSELEAIAKEVLTEREYMAWELVEIQGYSSEEAGIVLRRPGSAVRGLLFRGRAKLVSRLSQDESA